ncbi:unnamed protein product [Chironomus riparius]|uniref:Uncharacterized protein n=1 Tax=Chironomus riparius TaxID=315576 RepID=A0A9P0JB63_9DIPT|nr:unnamed protein product [Chironomus riparius]
MNMKIACFIILSLIPVALMESAENSAESSSAEAERTKRSGLAPLGGVIQSLQKSAFSASASLSQGSASGVAGLSGASSGGSGHDSHSYGHDYDEHHDTKAFDGWSLKKSILNTLLQAVKAIAGGVTTLQGQLIKGSGYLVTQKGKLIQSGGDAVSNAGKNIVASAHLIKPEHDAGHGYSAGGHGSSFGGSLGGSIGGGLGQAIGNSLGGLTKSITSLSAGSSSGITSASGASSAGSSSHGSSGGHSSNGHSDGYTSHGDYAAIDHGHGVTYTNSFDNYDNKPVTYESYGPPKSTVSHIEQPHAIYGTPEYNDGTYKFAETHTSSDDADMLSEILKNLPHKPMKTVGHVYSSGISFNQIPIPNDIRPPPFKPLKNRPSFDGPVYLPSHETPHSEYGVPHKEYGAPQKEYGVPQKEYGVPHNEYGVPDNEYGPPSSYSSPSSDYSQKQSIIVDPKAYDAYHSMRLKLSKPQPTATSLPGPITLLDGIVNHNGLEIQKSIAYEIRTR